MAHICISWNLTLGMTWWKWKLKYLPEAHDSKCRIVDTESRFLVQLSKLSSLFSFVSWIYSISAPWRSCYKLLAVIWWARHAFFTYEAEVNESVVIWAAISASARAPVQPPSYFQEIIQIFLRCHFSMLSPNMITISIYRKGDLWSVHPCLRLGFPVLAYPLKSGVAVNFELELVKYNLWS